MVNTIGIRYFSNVVLFFTVLGRKYLLFSFIHRLNYKWFEN